MYAVIFKAKINILADDYFEMAERMRTLAMNKYGCVEFTSLTEGEQEISISYWETKEQIQQWKSDPKHMRAQALGREKWYSSYDVQVVKILREYQYKGAEPLNNNL